MFFLYKNQTTFVTLWAAVLVEVVSLEEIYCLDVAGYWTRASAGISSRSAGRVCIVTHKTQASWKVYSLVLVNSLLVVIKIIVRFQVRCPFRAFFFLGQETSLASAVSNFRASSWAIADAAQNGCCRDIQGVASDPCSINSVNGGQARPGNTWYSNI